MSNKRKLKTAGRGPAERCASCGRRIGANMNALRLRTGRTHCPKCLQHLEPPRMSCGHVVLPGSFAVHNEGGNGDVRCPQCAPETTAQAGNLRLGLAEGDSRDSIRPVLVAGHG